MLQLARRGGGIALQALRGSASLSTTAALAHLPALQIFANESSKSSRCSSEYAALFSTFATVGAIAWHQTKQADAEAPAVAPEPASTSASQDSTNIYTKPTDLHGLPKRIVIYQYEICPFCCKVKTFLDYHKIPYSVVEVNPLTKAEIKWSDKYKKVPIIKLDDDVVVDSSRIISRLAAEVEGSKGEEQAPAAPARSPLSWLFGSGEEKKVAAQPEACSEEDEAKWREWVDTRFVKLVTANIYRNWNETWETFGYLSKTSNWGWVSREMARSSGAVIMWQVGRRMPKKYNIEGDIRDALYSDVAEFLAAVGDKPFLGGAKPNLADLAVFAVLRTVVGTGTHKDVMAKTDIAPWYERMMRAVGPSAQVPLTEEEEA